MTREEYLLKKRQLDRQYIEESGLIGKKLLSWIEEDGDLMVHIFVVKSVSIGGDKNIWINSSTEENYEVVYCGNDNTGLILGKEDNIDADVDCFDELSEEDFNIVREILTNGKNSADRLELYKEAADYLRLKGYTPR